MCRNNRSGTRLNVRLWWASLEHFPLYRVAPCVLASDVEMFQWKENHTKHNHQMCIRSTTPNCQTNRTASPWLAESCCTECCQGSTSGATAGWQNTPKAPLQCCQTYCKTNICLTTSSSNNKYIWRCSVTTIGVITATVL